LEYKPLFKESSDRVQREQKKEEKINSIYFNMNMD